MWIPSSTSRSRPQTLFEEINPGNKIRGTIVFDVPQGVKPARR